MIGSTRQSSPQRGPKAKAAWLSSQDRDRVMSNLFDTFGLAARIGRPARSVNDMDPVLREVCPTWLAEVQLSSATRF